MEELDDAEKASFAGAVSGLSTVVEELYDSIDFTHIGCDDQTGRLSPGGTGIPFTILKKESDYADLCGAGATAWPDKNGLYNFTEAHAHVEPSPSPKAGRRLPLSRDDMETVGFLMARKTKRRFTPLHWVGTST